DLRLFSFLIAAIDTLYLSAIIDKASPLRMRCVMFFGTFVSSEMVSLSVATSKSRALFGEMILIRLKWLSASFAIISIAMSDDLLSSDIPLNPTALPLGG